MKSTTLAESRKYDPAIDQGYGKRLSEVYFRLDRLCTSSSNGWPEKG